MKCPGQNTQFWKPEDIREADCPACGAIVEFWKDDAKRVCSRCGYDLNNPGKNMACALWCKSAKECLGLTPAQWDALKLEQERAKNTFERKLKEMKTKTTRKIIRIDEEKCTGCGECIPSCAEGALKIVDGKARLITDRFCDGLGACLSECPVGALTIEEREADHFDEEAVEEHLKRSAAPAACPGEAMKPAFSGCPSAQAFTMERREAAPSQAASRGPSLLGHWPIQLHLTNPSNPVFDGADLLVVSDCVPAAYRYFHEDFLEGRVPVMGCPKLDDGEQYVEKLTELFRRNDVKSVTIARMEVPCCGGMSSIVREAVKASGKDIPVSEAVVGVRGERR